MKGEMDREEESNRGIQVFIVFNVNNDRTLLGGAGMIGWHPTETTASAFQDQSCPQRLQVKSLNTYYRYMYTKIKFISTFYH
ncbi:hypothetical protein [Cytobacillus sp. FSL K6-0265]|uniref:hypothetical protein n=1 Tax=Cytobacillus sp. FSL K6-0265 TaxID=2921448 RepID=UPI0030FB0695